MYLQNLRVEADFTSVGEKEDTNIVEEEPVYLPDGTVRLKGQLYTLAPIDASIAGPSQPSQPSPEATPDVITGTVRPFMSELTGEEIQRIIRESLENAAKKKRRARRGRAKRVHGDATTEDATMDTS